MDLRIKLARMEKQAILVAAVKGMTKFLMPKIVSRSPAAMGIAESAMGHGLLGGALSAAFAPEGERWRGFGTGFAGGVGAGALGGTIGHGLGKLPIRGLKPETMKSLAKNIGMGAGYGGVMSYQDTGNFGDALRGMGVGALGGLAAGTVGGVGRSLIKNPSWGKSFGLGVGELGAHMGVYSLLSKDPNLQQQQSHYGRHGYPMSHLPARYQ